MEWKIPYCGFLTIETINRFEYPVLVVGKSIDTVVGEGTDIVPTVIPQIIDNQVEFFGQERPERVVEVDSKTVSVTQYEPRALRVPVTPQDDDSAIVHLNAVGG